MLPVWHCCLFQLVFAWHALRTRLILNELWKSAPYVYISKSLFSKLNLLFSLMLWSVYLSSNLSDSEPLSIAQIEPLVAPTKRIMQQRSITYTWHEFFPHGMILKSQMIGTWCCCVDSFLRTYL